MNKYIKVVILLVFASVANSRVATHNEFERGLFKLITKWKQGCDLSAVPIEFPSITPLEYDSMEFDTDSDTLSLRKIKVNGLKKMVVERLSASPENMNIKIEIYVPKLDIQADYYHLKGKSWRKIIIDHSGKFGSKMKNIRATASVQFATAGNDTIATDVKVAYSVGDIETTFENMGALVSSYANDAISSRVRSSETRIEVQTALKNIVTNHLKGHTAQEFINIISSL